MMRSHPGEQDHRPRGALCREITSRRSVSSRSSSGSTARQAAIATGAAGLIGWLRLSLLGGFATGRRSRAFGGRGNITAC